MLYGRPHWGARKEKMNKKKIIKFFSIILPFCFLCTFCHIQCNTVLDPDVYTPSSKQIVFYDEDGNESNYVQESVTITTSQDGRDHYACTEKLKLHFLFIASEDTQRLDIFSVKIINPKTGEIIITEDNKEDGTYPAMSNGKYYMFNKDGTNIIRNGKKLCQFGFWRGYIPTNPFNNKKGEEVPIDVEVAYKIDLGETQVSKSSYNVKIGGRRYDSESFKSQLLSTLYW